MRTVRKDLLGSAIALACLAAAAGSQAPEPYPQDYRLAPFALPHPTGPHPIGTRAFVVPVAGGAPLRVVAWYPAADASGPVQPYLDPAEQRVQASAIARNHGWPRHLLERVAALPTHAHAGARVAPGRFPLVIFSHGYLHYPRQNTALMERLASDGYIVLSLAHPDDAADLPDRDGMIPTVPMAAPGPELAQIMAFWNGSDHAARVKALPGFWKALDGGRMMASLDRWRGDIRRLADAIEARRVPADVRPLAAAADTKRLAYAGMSFGGSASASACQNDARCRGAVNLDGFEFDRTLYDHKLRMPLLLIQSDWTVFPNMGAPSKDFTIYDYAYERWADAGSSPTVYRFRIAGVKHMGLTDLSLAPADPVRERMFGPADGRAVNGAINDLVSAFLDRHVARRLADVTVTAARHPVIARHSATQVSRWTK